MRQIFLVMDLEQLQKMTPDEQQKTILALRQQAAIQLAQNLTTELSDKCIKKCITSPGTSLSSGEQQCLTRCMDRFMETYNLVQQNYLKRIQEMSLSRGGGMKGGTGSEGYSFS